MKMCLWDIIMMACCGGGQIGTWKKLSNGIMCFMYLFIFAIIYEFPRKYCTVKLDAPVLYVPVRFHSHTLFPGSPSHV